jgi:hypothetical protein
LDPLALRSDFGALGDAAGEFLRIGYIFQLDVVELFASGNEMHVRIVEAREDEFARGVDHFCVGTAPWVDFCIGTYCDDAVA